MPSIKENLNIALIIFLTLIIVVFVFLISFSSLYLKIPLSLDSITQIASAVVTTIAVVLTLGLRLVDDTLTRYQKFVQPKIRSIIGLIAGSNSGDIKSLIQNYSCILEIGVRNCLQLQTT